MNILYRISQGPGQPIVEAEPEEGRWYTGRNEAGQIGAIAKYVGGYFINSLAEEPPGINMDHYAYLEASR